MKPGMLALRETPLDVEYFQLNRQFPGALPATKNHQGGLTYAEDESDAKIFYVPDWPQCPVNAQSRTTWPSESRCRRSFSKTKGSGQLKVQPRARPSLVLQRTYWSKHARQHVENDEQTSRHRAASHKSVSQSDCCDRPARQQLRNTTF